MIPESIRISKRLSELLVISIFICGIILNDIAWRWNFCWFRYTIIVFLFLMVPVSKFYRNQSIYLPISVTDNDKNLKDIDVFHVIAAILSNLASYGICYTLYNPDWYGNNSIYHFILSCMFILFTYIAGNYLAYYHRTYKQHLRHFSFIRPLRTFLCISPFIVLTIESYLERNLFLAIFPFCLIFTVGFFRTAFSECSTRMYYFFLILTAITIIYFSYDIMVRFETVNGLLRTL